MATLSLVIPVFNEADRLPVYAKLVRSYMESTRGIGEYAVIVVDDGSTDGLAATLTQWSSSWPELRVLRHGTNRGKGAALRTGVLGARGDWVLLADADGATPIEELSKLRRAIEQGDDIAIGSRAPFDAAVSAHGESCGLEQRPLVARWRSRRVVGTAFGWAVQRMFGLPVRDTQCGFKMFRGDIARQLFGMCREDGFLIDIEVLLNAHRLAYKIAEVPVRWRDVPGSKVRIARDGVRMAWGLFRLRRRLRELATVEIASAASGT